VRAWLNSLVPVSTVAFLLECCSTFSNYLADLFLFSYIIPDEPHAPKFVTSIGCIPPCVFWQCEHILVPDVTCERSMFAGYQVVRFQAVLFEIDHGRSFGVGNAATVLQFVHVHVT